MSVAKKFASLTETPRNAVEELSRPEAADSLGYSSAGGLRTTVVTCPGRAASAEAARQLFPRNTRYTFREQEIIFPTNLRRMEVDSNQPYAVAASAISADLTVAVLVARETHLLGNV